MDWTQEAQAKLAEFAASGMSARKAAEKFGIGRGAVIGRANRTGVQFHNMTQPKRGGHRQYHLSEAAIRARGETARNRTDQWRVNQSAAQQARCDAMSEDERREMARAARDARWPR